MLTVQCMECVVAKIPPPERESGNFDQKPQFCHS